MGFTIEDMLVIAKDKYSMELIGGKKGWANSISWLLMVEDTTICHNFAGKELAVTTGVGFETEEKLLDFVKILDERHAAGLIINTGCYINEVPASVVDFCDKKDLPLMTCPWSVIMSEMIKDLTVRIFFQSQTDEQISQAFRVAIEHPERENEYRDTLSSVFDVDGKFQVVLFSTMDLDAMDSVERKRIGYRLQIYLENISHNAHFFYYDGSFIVIINEVDEESKKEILDGFFDRVRRRMPDKEVFVGEGSAVTDASLIYLSYDRAAFALKSAMRTQTPYLQFSDLGIYRLFYSARDKEIIKEISENALEPLTEYDEEHNADLVETLMNYIQYCGSIQKVAEVMFIHKNTIVYRMNKIKELLGSDLEDGYLRLQLYLAGLLRYGI